jgi:hypothetical protein
MPGPKPVIARDYIEATRRDQVLPQMHRRFAAKPHLAIALLTKP